MSYADQYHNTGSGKTVEISFKGARVYWRQGEDEAGRRAVTHVYPLRDKAHTEDLGKRAERFTLECFTLGNAFLAEAKKFKAACNTAGAGVLIHPLWGSISVVCLECRDRFTTRQGGMVEFYCVFSEEGENKYPSTDDDYTQIAADQAGASLAVFQASFTQAVSLQGPGWLAESQTADLDIALATLSEVVGVMLSAAAAGAMQDSMDQAASQLDDSTSDPTDVVDTAYAGFGGIYNQDPSGVFNASLAMLDFGMDVSDYGPGLSSISTSTASRLIEEVNRKSLTSLIAGYSAASLVRAALAMKYTSRQHAVSTRDLVMDAIDRCTLRAADLGDDAGYGALRDLQASTWTAFKAIIAEQLPALQFQVPAAVTPALNLAWRLYGDIGREQDILDRNPRILHPGFLPSGDAVEVLSA